MSVADDDAITNSASLQISCRSNGSCKQRLPLDKGWQLSLSYIVAWLGYNYHVFKSWSGLSLKNI